MRFKKNIPSIKGTLLTLLLPSGIILMAAAWLIHGLLLEKMSRDFIESRLKDEASFLEHHIRQAEGNVNLLKTGDYFEKVFHHAFAISSQGEVIISPSSWKPLLNPMLTSSEAKSIRVHDADFAQAPSDIFAYRKSFSVNGTQVTVIVSEDMGKLQRGQESLHIWTAIVSLLLILLLVCIIWFGINLSMRPVTLLQQSLKILQSGQVSRITTKSPEELRPLVEQLNQLLDSLDKRLERSRQALANLSHSVKTPITALRQILEDTGRPLNNELRQEMALRLAQLDKQLEAEMRRSQFAGPQLGKSAYPIKQARDLLWMLGRIYPDKTFELSTSITNECRWPIEEHDLNEILGNLLDNAGKWSTKCIVLSLERCNNAARIIVSDDGPGVTENETINLGQRGLRLDQQKPGHGLGLAIVQDIVAQYAGSIAFAKSTMGGLKVSIEISV